MKKWLWIIPVIIFIVSIPLLFYSKVSHKEEKAIDYIKNLKSYSCESNIILVNDKQAVEYNCKQYYDRKIGGRIEIGDSRVIIYKDNKAYVSDLKSNMKYTVDRDFDIIFNISMVSEYIKLMYTNEEIKISSKSIEGIEYTIVELHMPYMNRNLVKGRVYLNKDNYLPERLEILDSGNRIKVRVNYKNFIPNEDMDQSLFNL
ncbi:germination lipoprotein GerS-related protein [uncultured Clostridium sp.]|uniref:germination lipoprotein GerS-related protein n=1 Tax=uncultured Clostridium sp. TaxID=59620 RepID=UPI0028E20ED2|nr:germination lipoprotein GerS-related protein [uncultured Clostridium sp.]